MQLFMRSWVFEYDFASKSSLNQLRENDANKSQNEAKSDAQTHRKSIQTPETEKDRNRITSTHNYYQKSMP